MKKILLGSAAAICAAVGFSSFKVAHNNGTYYWFYISKNVQRVGGSTAALKNADVTANYIVSTTSTSLPSIASFPSCAGSSYYCVGGFTTAQLTAAHNHLKTSAVLSQTPFTAGYTRN